MTSRCSLANTRAPVVGGVRVHGAHPVVAEFLSDIARSKRQDSPLETQVFKQGQEKLFLDEKYGMGRLATYHTEWSLKSAWRVSSQTSDQSKQAHSN